MIFKSIWILILIPFIVGLILFIKRVHKEPSFRFPSTNFFSSAGSTWKSRFSGVPFILRILAIVLFLVALAGPRSVLEETVYKAEAIDIVLAIDSSGSMAAEDFTLNEKRSNRLDVVKDVVQDFIKGRQYDRIGLIAFAGVAYTVCPLTMDYAWLTTNLDRIELGLIRDGTAIGSAINSAVLRLQNSEAKSKVLILLTDGVNNAGKTDPIVAAQTAKTLGIKIYTIGAGTHGYAPFPVQDIFGRTYYQKAKVEMDEKVLKKISETTGGLYFRATDTRSLRLIYDEIDALEKTEIEQFGYQEYEELFKYFLIFALFLLGLELVLINTLFVRIP